MNWNRIIWMFAGQGSQYYQMGRELFEQEPLFRRQMLLADEIFGDLVHESLIHTLYQERPDRFQPFRRLLFSSPAILALENALAQLLLDRGAVPDALLGQSLGELACFVTAGVLSLETALKLIIDHSRLLEERTPPGGMLAILESDELVARFPAAFEGCEIAGWNFSRSFLVSGLEPALDRLRDFLQQQGVQVFPLPVAHAFHSRWTEAVAVPVRDLLQPLRFAPAKFPVISCARDLRPSENPVDRLWQVFRLPIDLPTVLRPLECSEPNLYVDLGPSGNMATAVKYNLRPASRSQYQPILTPFGQDIRNLRSCLERLGLTH